MVDWICSNYYCGILMVISYFPHSFFIYSFEFSVRNSDSFLPHLFCIQVCINASLWNHEYLVYYLCINLILSLFILFKLYKLWLVGAPVLFYKHFLAFWYHKIFQVHFYIVPDTAVESTIFPKISGSFYWITRSRH